MRTLIGDSHMLKRIALVIGLMLVLSSAARAADVIKVVVDPWAPFGGADLPNGGISLDVITTVLERAGYNVSAEILPWQRAMDGVQSGTYDILGNLFALPELEAHLTFSDPFYETEIRFLAPRGSEFAYRGLDSLRPYTIAVGAGYIYEGEFDAAEDLNKTIVTNVVQGVRMVASGRVDLTLDSVDVLIYTLARKTPELAPQLVILPDRLASQSLHMAIRNSHPMRENILKDFNRVLAEMRADGSLDRLLAAHRY